jgi:hypothetical protein
MFTLPAGRDRERDYELFCLQANRGAHLRPARGGDQVHGVRLVRDGAGYGGNR